MELLLALSMLGLLVFPVLASAAIWFVGRRRTQDRPTPTRQYPSGRRNPGGEPGRTS